MTRQEEPLMSSDNVATMTAADSTERTVETITAELDAARLARESASGRVKANMTRQIKALEAELATLAPKTEPVRLVELEADIVAAIKTGTLGPHRDEVARYGDDVLTRVGIKFYRADRWDGGRWLSTAMWKRIERATKDEAAA